MQGDLSVFNMTTQNILGIDITGGTWLNVNQSIVNSIRKEYESKIKLKEIEINEMYSRQKEEQIEHERLKFAAKLESIKNQLKNDYDRLLKVSFILL